MHGDFFQHGKDFGKILSYMRAKAKKRKQRDPFIENLTKNQVRLVRLHSFFTIHVHLRTCTCTSTYMYMCTYVTYLQLLISCYDHK